MKWNLFPSTFLRGPRSACDCIALWLYATLSTTTLLCAQDKWIITWTANLEAQIQVYSITEKFIIRKETVLPSFQEPEQGWNVLTEKDWYELRKYNVTTKNWIYRNFSTCYMIVFIQTHAFAKDFSHFYLWTVKRLQKPKLAKSPHLRHFANCAPNSLILTI